MTASQRKRPWHREPMVWLVIAIPLTSVVLGVAMISIALTNHDGLVVDDYYKRGLEINRTLERDARASALELTANVELDAGSNRVSLHLDGRPSFRAPEEIRLGFYHATRQGEDRVLSLRADARGVYSAPMPALSPGRWYVSAETPQWRLTRVVRFPAPGGFTIFHEGRAAGDSNT